ncbi:MAG TPA: GNAT family N-acetyltransferase [Methanocella sp.]|nr:GNAT family N-acetyltransferase [Methanocella sp.]
MESLQVIYLKNGQSVRILKAGVADAEEILALQKIAYITEAEIYDFDIPPLKQTHNEIVREFSDHIFLKAETKGRIAGSVRARGMDDTCLIGRLIVDPVFRGQGIGTALMTTIEREFAAFKRYELFTGDRSERNIALYERLGYHICRSEQVSCSLKLVFLEKYADGPR